MKTNFVYMVLNKVSEATSKSGVQSEKIRSSTPKLSQNYSLNMLEGLYELECRVKLKKKEISFNRKTSQKSS